MLPRICINCLWHEYSEVFKECDCMNDKGQEEQAHNAYCDNNYYTEDFYLVECRWFSEKPTNK